MLMTTPFRIPRDGAVPTPTMFRARSASISPIKVQTLVVPTSRATTACSRGTADSFLGLQRRLMARRRHIVFFQAEDGIRDDGPKSGFASGVHEGATLG